MNAVYKLLHTRWPSVLWTAIIFYALSIPGAALPSLPLFPHFDKVVHIILFTGLSFLWSWYFTNKSNEPIIKRILLVFVVSTLYGVLMEYYQKCCVAFRGFEVDDMIADGVGALLGCSLVYIKKIGLYRNRGRNQN